MNLFAILNELKAEQAAGNEQAAQLVERIDAHIRDLETLKAWVIDSATARSMALGGMLGGEAPAPVAAAVAPAEPRDEAA
jgi:hypothetical protein